MRIIKTLVLASALGFCLLSGNVSRASAEQIDNFDVTVKMNSDASIDVMENIVYDFGGMEKHGIYRNIPVRYDARGGNYSLRMSDIHVNDEKGAAYDYSAYGSGSDEVIKIGNADILVTGKKTYVIRYKIKGAINYFNDHDELYWNATGNEWTVPIAEASARVIFPQNITDGNTQIKCYAGVVGSVAACESAQYVFADSSLVSGASFTARNLSSGVGLSFVAGIPVGIVSRPSAYELFLKAVEDNLILLLPIFVFLIMFALWWKKGRDPEGRKTIIPEYDVPDNLSPAEVGTIVDEECGQKEIVGEIINLAVMGYLKIKREEKEVLFIKSADYSFEKLKDSADLSSRFQIDLLEGIFADGKKEVKFSELKGDFYQDYNKVVKGVYASVYDKGYFSGNPRNTIAKYMVLAIVFIIVLYVVFVADMISVIGVYGILSLILSIIIIVYFAKMMPQKTYKGVVTKEHILGLKDYMTVAEKDRLEFHDAPEKNPQQFEKLLPYAIVLGVEKQWAKQFEGIYNNNPSWYADSRGFNNFSSLYFVSALGDFRSNFASTAIVPPAASGSSGFGGGGFSGGGFGGGGGGSW